MPMDKQQNNMPEKEVLKSIDVIREAMDNAFEVNLQSYIELRARLNYLELILTQKKY